MIFPHVPGEVGQGPGVSITGSLWANAANAGVYAPSHRIADKCSLGRAQSIRQHLLAQGVAATQLHPALQGLQLPSSLFGSVK